MILLILGECHQGTRKLKVECAVVKAGSVITRVRVFLFCF